jgi:1,4-alpha-glucan branching enzyme
VYAHTGVLTEKSATPSSWRYVKTNWGVNTPETKLSPLGSDKWQFRFHIRSYYGVPTTEKITHLAFVFRNAGSTREGKTETGGDIFLPVYEQGLQVSVLRPVEPFTFIAPGDSVPVLAAATGSQEISLYIDEQKAVTVNNDSLRYTIKVLTVGKKTIRVTARSSSGAEKSTLFYIIVHNINATAELPAGVRDGINYQNDGSVTLVLYAPFKQFVYILGDFTNWDIRPEYMMKRTANGHRYWLNLPGLQQGKEYIFQYFVDGKIKIADPYCEKISDPLNDGYISPSTYPNLLPYPIGKTTEIAGVLQTGQTPFTWRDGAYVKPARENLVIYELLLRDFLGRHDFRTLCDTLNYFQRLGVNAIELMPVSEFEGNSCWGYNPSFYFAPDKYYGPKADLQRFVDEAHRRGIAVIQDIVLNHSYGQSPMVRLYAADMVHSPWFNIQSPNTVYSWGYDFDHTAIATQNFVDRVTSFWLTEYHMDGFRFDFSKGFTNTPGDGWAYDASRIALLKRIADKIWQQQAGAYVILEHFTDNNEERELTDYGMLLWGNMNYNYNEATMGYHGGKSDFTRTSYLARSWNQPHLVAYMESHDEERLMFKNLSYGNSGPGYSIKDTTTALRRMELAAAFFLTIPGPKMLWQFGEMGYDYSIDTNGRLGEKPLRWNYLSDQRRQHLWNVMARLIRLKTSHPAMSTADFSLAVYPSVKRINLNHSSASFAIIGNFDIVAAQIDPAFQHVGQWYEFFSGDSLQVQDMHGLITLQPGEYRMYADKRIPEQGATFIASTPSSAVPQDFSLAANYPNPFNDETMIRFTIAAPSQVSLDVFNVRGEWVARVFDHEVPAGIYETRWNGRDSNGRPLGTGVYFLRGRMGEEIAWQRMLLLR